MTFYAVLCCVTEPILGLELSIYEPEAIFLNQKQYWSLIHNFVREPGTFYYSGGENLTHLLLLLISSLEQYYPQVQVPELLLQSSSAPTPRL